MIEPYILGLWLGDKYWWGSSIGLTNTNMNLIKVFRNFLEKLGFPKERIKLSVYHKDQVIDESELAKKLNIHLENIKVHKFKKGKKVYFIIYVNSRPLKRIFYSMASNLENCIKNYKGLLMYITGRFDSDGWLNKKYPEVRISYTTEEEARKDANLIEKFLSIKPRVRFEKYSNTWIINMKGKIWLQFIKDILKFSNRDFLRQSHRQLVP